MIPFSFIKTTAAAWTPASLPSILGWVDASNSGSVTTVSSKVSQINDLSGNSNNFTQGTAGNRPTYSLAAQNGLNVMTYSTASFLATTNGLASTSKASLCYLLKTGATLASTQLFFNGNKISGYVSSDSKWTFDWGGVTGDPFIQFLTSANTWYRLVIVFDSTQSSPNNFKLYINNVNVANNADGAASAIPTATLNVGDQNGSSSWTGLIAEMAYTSSALGTTDIGKLDTYWTGKWAV